MKVCTVSREKFMEPMLHLSWNSESTSFVPFVAAAQSVTASTGSVSSLARQHTLPTACRCSRRSRTLPAALLPYPTSPILPTPHRCQSYDGMVATTDRGPRDIQTNSLKYFLTHEQSALYNECTDVLFRTKCRKQCYSMPKIIPRYQKHFTRITML